MLPQYRGSLWEHSERHGRFMKTDTSAVRPTHLNVPFAQSFRVGYDDQYLFHVLDYGRPGLVRCVTGIRAALRSRGSVGASLQRLPAATSLQTRLSRSSVRYDLGFQLYWRSLGKRASFALKFGFIAEKFAQAYGGKGGNFDVLLLRF